MRLIGDRKAIEAKTTSWDKTVEDRQNEIEEWVSVCRKLSDLQISTFVYVNNHFAGHAPATIASFLDLWNTGPRAMPWRAT